MTKINRILLKRLWKTNNENWQNLFIFNLYARAVAPVIPQFPRDFESVNSSFESALNSFCWGIENPKSPWTCSFTDSIVSDSFASRYIVVVLCLKIFFQFEKLLSWIYQYFIIFVESESEVSQIRGLNASFGGLSIVYLDKFCNVSKFSIPIL